MRNRFRPANVTGGTVLTFFDGSNASISVLNADNGVSLGHTYTAPESGELPDLLGPDGVTSLVIKDGATTLSTTAPMVTTQGPLVQSPDGTWYRVVVANGGALSTVAV